MTGTAVSQVRSAHVAEVTPGTTPATPAFATSHAPIRMMAKAQTVEGRSQVAKGARMGQGVLGIDVTGTMESPLIYGVYDDWFASLLQGAWSTNVLKDGKAVAARTVENMFPAGVGGTNTMLRYRGVEAIGGTLNLASRAAAQLSLNFAGRGSDAATTTAITGATYTDPTVLDPLSSGTDVGTIVFNGYTLDCMSSMEINFAFEGRDIQPRIGSDDLCGITRGDFLPTITARFRIEANFLAIYNASRARHSAFSLTVPLGSVTGEKYTLVFPACRFSGPEIDMSGTDLMQNVPIVPFYDTSSSAVLTMTRAIA